MVDVRLTNKEKKMTKFASVKKLIDLKRKQRHIIKSFRTYDDINNHTTKLILVSIQIKTLSKKLRRV